MSFEAAVHAKAIQLDQLSLDMTAASGSGHPTTAMSLGHIVTVLLYQSMRWIPSDPTCPTADRLVLSEGHAVPIVYAACADLGTLVGKDPATRRALTIDDLKGLRNADSVLDGHPNPAEGFPFFDAATGSLGQGLSIAAGLGLAARQDGLDRRIWCIVGDGESREGQIWEALEFLVDQRLGNVVPIFNCNQYGQSDKVSSLQSAEAIARKLEAIGIVAIAIDGHDPKQIKDAFDRAAKAGTQMHAVVARTVKGWGSATVQGGGWHGKPATGDKLKAAKDELDSMRLKLTSSLASSGTLKPTAPAVRTVAAKPATDPMTFPQAMKAFDMASVMGTGKFATRKAYGLALRAAGRANPAVWALDADVKNSTFAEWFANDRELSSRFVECKIAEQNMASVAVGLSAAGKIPFASSFAKFLTRAYDQIEMGMNSGANLKLVGSHSGITPCSDGPSQMALPDVAWFRSLASVRDHRGNPGCYILQPSDAWSAYALTQVMAEYEGMCYMRTFRPEVEFLYGADTVFNLGKFEVLTEGRDLMIVTAGLMVHECNKAIAELDRMGIDATLVDLYSIPFDRDALLDLANRNGGNILTVEDNYGAGIGGAVAEACCDAGDAFTVRQMFVSRIPKSCRTEDEVMRMCGLDPKSIVSAAAAMVGVRQ
jgi:transketolase